MKKNKGVVMLKPITSCIYPANRQETRINMRRFVEIKALTSQQENRLDALTSDISDSGVGLLTTVTFPIGTKIEINEDGKLVGRGEVIDIDEWDVYNLARLGVRLTEIKDGWPI
jgi:hypothetical protein